MNKTAISPSYCP